MDENQPSTTPLNRQLAEQGCILFLGAGASTPLGFPAMSDFMDRLEGRVKPGLRSVLQHIYQEHKRGKIGGRDLEIVLGALRKYREYFELTNGDKRLRHKLSAEVKLFGSRTRDLYDQTIDLLFEEYGNPVPIDVANLFGPLVSALRDVIHTPLIPVFSTNYDACLEAYGDQTGDSVEFGFDRGYVDSSWDPSRFHRIKPTSRRMTLVLFKLHGSVTWYRSKQGVIKYIQASQRDLAGHENMVIYPGEAKLELMEEPFHTCYLYLRHCLSNTRRVIVIGYSFRDLILQRAFFEAARMNPRLKFIVMNGKVQAAQQKRVSEQLGGECTFIPHRFEPIVDGNPEYLEALKSALA